MTKLEVRYVTLKDALGRTRVGWSVVENGRPGYPLESKDKAIQQAEAIREIRKSNSPVTVQE